jgi:hypothetical protein
MRVRHLPTVAQAFQYDGDNADAICTWAGPDAYQTLRGELIIHTREGEHVAHPDDFVIRRPNGRSYPISPADYEAGWEWIGDGS